MGLASRCSEASHDCLLCASGLMMRKLQTSAACGHGAFPAPRCMPTWMIAKGCSLIWTAPHVLQALL